MLVLLLSSRGARLLGVEDPAPFELELARKVPAPVLRLEGLDPSIPVYEKRLFIKVDERTYLEREGVEV